MYKELKIEGCNKTYLIDEDGNIYDVKEKKFRKPVENKKGYYKVTFYINKKLKGKFVHRLVAETFNPVEGMENLHIDHIDCNKKNNNINNLEWVTPTENSRRAWKNGLCENSTPSGNEAHHRKITEEDAKEIRRMLSKRTPIKEIMKKFNISRATVYQIKNGVTWKEQNEENDTPTTIG